MESRMQRSDFDPGVEKGLLSSTSADQIYLTYSQIKTRDPSITEPRCEKLDQEGLEEAPYFLMSWSVTKGYAEVEFFLDGKTEFFCTCRDHLEYWSEEVPVGGEVPPKFVEHLSSFLTESRS